MSSCNTTPALKDQECVFNQVTKFVQIFVVGSLLVAIPLGRYDNFHALIDRIPNGGIRIISTVCKHHFCIDALNQGTSL